MRNYAALIAEARQSNGLGSVGRQIDLTPSVFGKVLVAAWAAHMGRSDFPRRDLIMRELLAAAGTAPPEVKAVMHVDDCLTGPAIAEYSEYMAAAQMDGLVKRYNPDYVRVAVEIDRLTGKDILEMYTHDRPHVRKWIEDVVGRLVDARNRWEHGEEQFERGASTASASAL